jgi:hypothetical protein
MRSTHKKSRDTLIAETTERLLADWNAELQAGSQRAINDLHNTVLERLAEDEAKAIFVQAMTDTAGAQAQFGALVAKAALEVCVADAERTVDLLFSDMATAKTESRIDRVLDAQAA